MDLSVWYTVECYLKSRINWTMAYAHCYATANETHAPAKNGIQQKWIWTILKQRLDKYVTANTQQYGKMCFLCGPCLGVILKTTGATQTDSCVEAGSNTSTVTMRVVGGDENGSLKSETVKYGYKSPGTTTKKDCAGKDHQHIQKTDRSSRQRGRPTKARP
jgi:hypothetical protein